MIQQKSTDTPLNPFATAKATSSGASAAGLALVAGSTEVITPEKRKFLRECENGTPPGAALKNCLPAMANGLTPVGVSRVGTKLLKSLSSNERLEGEMRAAGLDEGYIAKHIKRNIEIAEDSEQPGAAGQLLKLNIGCLGYKEDSAQNNVQINLTQLVNSINGYWPDIVDAVDHALEEKDVEAVVINANT